MLSLIHCRLEGVAPAPNPIQAKPVPYGAGSFSVPFGAGASCNRPRVLIDLREDPAHIGNLVGVDLGESRVMGKVTDLIR